MMNDQGFKLVGYVEAHIGYDWSYGSKITVHRSEFGEFTIDLLERSPWGGMDGDKIKTHTSCRDSVTLNDPSPSQLVKAIRSLIDDTIKTYGKPTKRFQWVAPGLGTLQGLSITNAKMVLGAFAAESRRNV